MSKPPARCRLAALRAATVFGVLLHATPFPAQPCGLGAPQPVGPTSTQSFRPWPRQLYLEVVDPFLCAKPSSSSRTPPTTGSTSARATASFCRSVATKWAPIRATFRQAVSSTPGFVCRASRPIGTPPPRHRREFSLRQAQYEDSRRAPTPPPQPRAGCLDRPVFVRWRELGFGRLVQPGPLGVVRRRLCKQLHTRPCLHRYRRRRRPTVGAAVAQSACEPR